MSVTTILHNGKIATNGVQSFVEAIAIGDAKITDIGTDEEIMRHRKPETKVRGRISGPTGAAARLGIPRQTLDRKILSLGIDKNRFKAR